MSGLRLSEREVARLITLLERGDRSQISSLPSGQGHAHVIGVTGPPGSGKSTLVNALGTAVRAAGQTMAVLAIDPSSHLTGGAVLGDRVRMSSHSSDDGVFIRSMGTRGSGTGLATAARDAVRVLDAAGYDVVVVETVGVGQVELDVLTVADTVAVVMVPGLGDTMQMNKAGIMEIGDVYVVNMADRPETDRFVKDLRQALALGARHDELPPICPTTAPSGEGVPDLWAALVALDRRDRASGRRERQRQAQLRREFDQELRRHVLNRLAELQADSERLGMLRGQILAGGVLPSAAADEWATHVELRD